MVFKAPRRIRRGSKQRHQKSQLHWCDCIWHQTAPVTRSEMRPCWCGLHRLPKNALPSLREVKLRAGSILAHLFEQPWRTGHVRLSSSTGPPRFLPAGLASPASFPEICSPPPACSVQLPAPQFSAWRRRES